MIPLPYHLLLRRPRRIRDTLRRLRQAGTITREPTLFQVWIGVLYMLYRLAFRTDTVGIADAPVRDTRRARLLQYRVLRVPVVLALRVVNPFDLVGLGTDPAWLVRHIAGTYHPGDNAVYDVALLTAYPEHLDALSARVRAIRDESHPRARLYKDVCVYAGYHDRLLELIDRFRAGEPVAPAALPSDATLPGFVEWMCRQPPTLRDALRAGLSLDPRSA